MFGIGLLLMILLLPAAQEIVPAIPPAIPTLQPLSQFTLQCDVTGATAAATYQWQQMAGPAGSPFATPNAKNTIVSFIEPGTYLVRCVVSETGKMTTWADWSILVGANYTPEPPPTSVLKATIVQIPPPSASDTVKPQITKVMYGALQLTEGQTVTLTSPTYAGFNVTASDNSAVLNAHLIVAGTRVHEIGLDSALPVAFNLWWLKAAIAPGTYPAIIRVFDGSGNFAEFKFTVRR